MVIVVVVVGNVVIGVVVVLLSPHTSPHTSHFSHLSLLFLTLTFTSSHIFPHFLSRFPFPVLTFPLTLPLLPLGFPFTLRHYISLTSHAFPLV